jgi:hypothetical protein
MPVIENLKNLIRHKDNADPSSSSPPKHSKRHKDSPPKESKQIPTIQPQEAPLAAYNPPGGGMTGMIGQNPAVEEKDGEKPSEDVNMGVSPGVTGKEMNFSGMDNKDRAEQMVKDDNARKRAKAPKYDGLGDDIELLEKMGE